MAAAKVDFESSADFLIKEMILIPTDRTIWPSGLRRWLQAPVRKGVGSNPTVVTFFDSSGSEYLRCWFRQPSEKDAMCVGKGRHHSPKRQSCTPATCKQMKPERFEFPTF